MPYLCPYRQLPWTQLFRKLSGIETVFFDSCFLLL